MRRTRTRLTAPRAARTSEIAARRAVARWAWRLFRREWRQQVVALALLTVAVAAAVGFASAAYTTAPVPDEAQFGSADHFYKFGGSDPETLAADVADAREWFDDIEVIYHDSVEVPGVYEPVDYRAQDPDGPFGGPRLALLDGSYPAGDQVAVTDGIADLLGLDIGASIALDGVSRTVAGIVENPGDLADEFVLLPPSQIDQAESVTILVNTSEEQYRSFRISSGGLLEGGSRLANADVIAAVSTLVLATVGLLLVALIAAASFVVIAHRRMRQLGMLAAIGATEKQLRLVTLANGTVIGIVAAVIGATIGFAGWVVLMAPRVEDTVGYRVDELNVPWWLIVAAMLLAIVAATAAAWWPARSVSHVSPVHALSGRPPEPRPARRATALAGVFGVIGATCLVASDVSDESVELTDALLVVAGIVAVALAVLFAGPLAIRLLARCVGRLPVAVRLAIGDLARYRARAGAALAAISLVLGIAVTVVVIATATQNSDELGNLPENQLLIRAEPFDGPFVPTAEDLERLQTQVDRIVASLGDPSVTRLDVALYPEAPEDPTVEGRMGVALAEPSGDGWRDLSLLYAATPQLLEPYGVDLDSIPPSTEVITRETGDDLVIVGDPRSRAETVTDVQTLSPGYPSLPGTFVTADIVRERGWVTVPSGRWVVEMSGSPTSEQLAAAREAAAGGGLTIEVRDTQGGLTALRSGATATGMLVALGILAMTVGLVRIEAGRDLRVLTATGATSGIRRTLTAATAGGLAVLGVALGMAGAYLGLTAGFSNDLGALTPIPIANLAMIAVGVPLSAAAVGWLVSGRAVPDISRQPMD